MAIGHNFGCEAYRNSINDRGHKDDKATWRNLRALLEDAALSIESCFMTNWFIGLLPGNRQVRKFLHAPSPRYESECRGLLLEEIKGLKPKLILLLGLNVVSRAYEIMPSLSPWAGATNWKTVDGSSLGSMARRVEVSGTGVRANIVPLLHPSFSPPNQRFRAGLFPLPKPEVEMLRQAAFTKA
jgi:uracil-DNA glycosylase